MMKGVFILVFFPFIASTQIVISTNLIERTNEREKITLIDMLNNISIGSFINNNLILGVTNEDAVSDYIDEGYNPIQDSLIISNSQFFLKYYTDDIFFLMKMPPFTNFSNISINNNIRVGVGYVIYKDEDLDFELSYNRLINANQNGFHKGELNLGISTSISTLMANRKYKNFQGYSFVNNFFRSVLDRINKPLAYGYRESI